MPSVMSNPLPPLKTSWLLDCETQGRLNFRRPY
nr:MAG TPA: DNA topoisomerase 2-binding protein 1 DOMAIN, DNA REPAIR, CELL.26A [Bacteriophage sp.]